MYSTKMGHRSFYTMTIAAGGMGLLLLVALEARCQEASERIAAGASYPRMPGAVTKAPAWLGADAPFDVKEFFKVVPREKNAALLYLDALFEFSGELEVCFPEGPDRSRRGEAARDRAKRHYDLTQSVAADPKLELDPAQVDAVIKLYDAGYRKLAEAQRFDRCVFETGFDIATMLPHAQASRQVVRVSALKVQRDLQRGDPAAAIREIEMVLRLVRDLRPRGAEITQLVADADSQVIFSVAVPAILAAPRLRAEQCERLVKVLETHEAKSLDGYAEGLRAEYIVARSTLEAVVYHQSDLAMSLRLKSGESVVRTILRYGAYTSTAAAAATSGLPDGNWDGIVARATPAEVSRQAKEIARFYRTLLDLSTLPYAPRIKKTSAFKPPMGTDLLARVAGISRQPERLEAVARSFARTTASLRAMECLLALRRWQMSHRGLPKDLSSVARGAALKTVPLDPYDGKPMKLAVVDGQPIVYSVGRDGTDNGGLVDAGRDQKPTGDLIYRPSPIEEKPRLRP
jgi:hypothetical protein